MTNSARLTLIMLFSAVIYLVPVLITEFLGFNFGCTEYRIFGNIGIIISMPVILLWRIISGGRNVYAGYSLLFTAFYYLILFLAAKVFLDMKSTRFRILSLILIAVMTFIAIIFDYENHRYCSQFYPKPWY